MSGMRGNIPRRKPDLRRKPLQRPAPTDNVDGDNMRAKQGGGVPVFHDLGRIVMQPDATVLVFNYRFPSTGRVREASIRLLGVPLGVELSVAATANGEEIFNAAWPLGKPLLKIPDNLTVDEYAFLAVTLSRKGGEEPVVIGADIAFIFQEHPRAKVQPPVR